MASLPPKEPLPPDVFNSLPPEEDVPPNIFTPNPRDVRGIPLSGREKVAVWFATALLALIVFLCISLLWQWHVPMPAAGASGGAIESYKALTELVDERTGKFFDLTITKTLLPVFTTLIGFLLGRRSKED
jgi:hypothetical protein